MIKVVIRGLLNFWILIKVKILKLKGRLFGEFVVNRYIENCSERQIKTSLSLLGAKIDNTSNFKGGLIFDNTGMKFENLEVEENCYVGKKVFIDLVAPVRIKKDAVVSAGVTILTHQDVGDRMLKQYFERNVGEVIIDEGAWIGANATILNGIKIGKCAVVAAGAVVNRDVEPYTVVGGVPAKELKKLNI